MGCKITDADVVQTTPSTSSGIKHVRMTYADIAQAMSIGRRDRVEYLASKAVAT